MSTDKQKLALVPPTKRTRAEEILSAIAAPDVFDESEIFRMGGGSAANGDKNDPIVITGKSELAMRKMIAKYGFDRMPLTYGEFQGLLDYCEHLDLVVGEGLVPPERELAWSKNGGVEMWESTMHDYKDAGRLYAEGKPGDLLRFHRDHDVLTKLGRNFKEFTEKGISSR